MRTLVYIVGCANCGSTLLTALLGRHPAISTVGELKATAIRDLENYLCGCGVKLLECNFWKQVRQKCSDRELDLQLDNFATQFRSQGWLSDRILRAGVRGDAFEGLRSTALACYPPASESYATALKRNEIIIDSVCETLKKPVFLDSSKDPTRALHFSRSGRFKMKIIHLVRDGRAIVASYKKRSSDHANNVVLWRSKAEECERLKLSVPANEILTIRYEDLCLKLDDVLAQLYAFIGVEAGGSSASQQESQHILGHNSRLGGNKEVKFKEEWKTMLSPEELAEFRAAEGTVNSMYGYAPWP